MLSAAFPFSDVLHFKQWDKNKNKEKNSSEKQQSEDQETKRGKKGQRSPSTFTSNTVFQV